MLRTSYCISVSPATITGLPQRANITWAPVVLSASHLHEGAESTALEREVQGIMERGTHVYVILKKFVEMRIV
jgi:hypothetical protein